MPSVTSIGQIDGQEVRAVTLSGTNGLRVGLLTYGARLAELWVPDRTGQLADIVLGHDSLADWQTQGGYLGATCGRYANRIAEGRFVIDGQTVQLDRNEGTQHLHGGTQGLDRVNWDLTHADDRTAAFSTRSPAGTMGYPGNLVATVVYQVTAGGLLIEMTAVTDAPTVVNLVNHAYFNLAGQGSGSVLDQVLQIEAAHYLPTDAQRIPTGETLSVRNTPYDFRTPRSIGQPLPDAGGFDHCLCLSAPMDAEGLRPCATAFDPASGRRLQLSTTEPGVQLYTGAHFDGTPGKSGARYDRFAGFALETQRFPNSPNMPHFPTSRLDPGQPYRHLMRFDFAPE